MRAGAVRSKVHVMVTSVACDGHKRAYDNTCVEVKNNFANVNTHAQLNTSAICKKLQKCKYLNFKNFAVVKMNFADVKKNLCLCRIWKHLRKNNYHRRKSHPQMNLTQL